MLNTATTNGIVPMVDLNGGNNGMWGDGGWWIILLLFVLGFNGNWGNNGGNNQFIPYTMGNLATNESVQSAVDTLTTNSKLDTIGSDINGSMFTLNNAISGGFGTLNTYLCSAFDAVQNAITNLGYNLQASTAQIGYALDGVKYENAQNTNAIIQAGNANTQRLLDVYTANEIQGLRDELQSARFQISQSQQTATIVNAVNGGTAAQTTKVGA